MYYLFHSIFESLNLWSLLKLRRRSVVCDKKIFQSCKMDKVSGLQNVFTVECLNCFRGGLSSSNCLVSVF